MAPAAGWERGLQRAQTADRAGTAGMAETLGALVGIENAPRLQPDLEIPKGQASICAVGARFVGDEHLIVDLADGRQIIACLPWFPRLCCATAAEREAWELEDGGLGVLWRGIGERLLVPQLLGFPGEATLTGDDESADSELSASLDSAAGTASDSGTLLSPALGVTSPLRSSASPGGNVPVPSLMW